MMNQDMMRDMTGMMNQMNTMMQKMSRTMEHQGAMDQTKM
jgi:hypothetical protein